MTNFTYPDKTYLFQKLNCSFRKITSIEVCYSCGLTDAHEKYIVDFQNPATMTNVPNTITIVTIEWLMEVKGQTNSISPPVLDRINNYTLGESWQICCYLYFPKTKQKILGVLTHYEELLLQKEGIRDSKGKR